MEGQIMNDLWIKYESLRGRATVFSRVTCVEMLPTHDDAPDNIQDLKEINAYYTGICDAAIAVIEANQANNGLPY